MVHFYAVGTSLERDQSLDDDFSHHVLVDVADVVVGAALRWRLERLGRVVTDVAGIELAPGRRKRVSDGVLVDDLDLLAGLYRDLHWTEHEVLYGDGHAFGGRARRPRHRRDAKGRTGREQDAHERSKKRPARARAHLDRLVDRTEGQGGAARGLRAGVFAQDVVQDGDVLHLNWLNRGRQSNRRGAGQHGGLGLVRLSGDGLQGQREIGEAGHVGHLGEVGVHRRCQCRVDLGDFGLAVRREHRVPCLSVLRVLGEGRGREGRHRGRHRAEFAGSGGAESGAVRVHRQVLQTGRHRRHRQVTLQAGRGKGG